MEILIKNMEMPERCRGCRFHHIHKIWSKNIYLHECDAQMLAEETEGMEAVKLPKACPLVALPEHGRLIDADKLLAESGYDPMMFQPKYGGDHRTQYGTLMGYEILGIVEDAPTIVEASNGTDN